MNGELLGINPYRILAMLRRHWYVLSGSWTRVVELIYWPAVQMIMWGFLTQFLAGKTSFVAQAFGVFLAGMMLWDSLFRVQLGVAISFLEEMWARNLGNLFVSPLRPSEFALSVLLMGVLRALVGMIPVSLMAWWFFGFSLYEMGFGLAAFAIGHLPSPFAAAGGFVVLSLLLFIVAQLAFQYSLVWLNLSFALLSILLNTSFVALSRIVQERRGRRDMERQKSNLSRYHSPMIADLLAHGMPETAGRRQLAAIMFIDLADFTARCETMAPEVAADFLRAFHGRVERVVLAHGGMLDQFLGDGAMVIFGIRGAAPQDPVTALACGRRLLDDISDWSRQLETQGQPPLVVRVGIHYGPVVISRLGGSSQMHFSAAGDTVNVAARLESIGRSPTSTISISSAWAAAVQAQGRHDLLQGFTELPPQPIRGRSEKLSVWTLQHANAA